MPAFTRKLISPVGRRAASALLLAAAFVVSGCGYGEVSRRGYEHATALYSICNRRDVERLDAYAQLVESEVVAGRLSQQEADWMQDIVALARDGNWQAASGEVRQLLEDQVVHP